MSSSEDQKDVSVDNQTYNVSTGTKSSKRKALKSAYASDPRSGHIVHSKKKR